MDVPDFHEEEKYNAVARFFHWVIAFLIVFMLGLGLTMEDFNFGVPREYVYDLHKSLGLLILLLAVARIIWRFASVPPEALDTHAPWERALAKAAHGFLYFALIAMPLSGWLMSDAAGRPPTFFGLPVPRLMGYDDSLRQLFGAVHFYLAWGLILVIGLHVAGALKHHLIDKDGTLRRMAGDRLSWLKAVILFLVLDIVLMIGAFIMLKEAALPTAAVRSPSTLSFSVENLSGYQWRIDPENSAIRFSSSAFGTGFTGTFGAFDGAITFDPENLSGAKADIIIDMTNITSGDAERDVMAKGDDWFASNTYSQARFTTHTIEPLEDGRYLALGELRVRDTTMPLSFPFTLTFTQQEKRYIAHMQAQATLNRLDFGVGQGEWEGTEVVPDAVSVSIDLKAVQPR